MVSISLGGHFEKFVQDQIAHGRYHTPSEVVQDALRLMEDREKQLTALDAAIEQGLDDIAAGRVYDADSVFDELDRELAALPDKPGE
jgi:antitoxin ParD1/3/4